MYILLKTSFLHIHCLQASIGYVEYNGGIFSVDSLSLFYCLFNCLGWFKLEVLDD